MHLLTSLVWYAFMCAVLCFDPKTLIFALLATGRPGNGQRTQRLETVSLQAL